jgi:hypothetical protein
MHKTVLFAFLQPSLAIMDGILLSFAHPPSDLARSILFTLANMSYLTAGGASGMEGWDRLFYGCLDVMAATRTQMDLRDIADGPSCAQAGIRESIADANRRYSSSICANCCGAAHAACRRASGLVTIRKVRPEAMHVDNLMSEQIPATPNCQASIRSCSLIHVGITSRCERKQYFRPGCLHGGVD